MQGVIKYNYFSCSVIDAVLAPSLSSFLFCVENIMILVTFLDTNLQD